MTSNPSRRAHHTPKIMIIGRRPLRTLARSKTIIIHDNNDFNMTTDMRRTTPCLLRELTSIIN